MLITPRTYSASQTPDRTYNHLGGSSSPRFYSLAGWNFDSTDAGQATEMLFIRQAGSVRVGEVIRYTLTYTPATDDVRPPPAALHVKVKNTSAKPLRAAYLHGPYTLYVSCYPSSFDPNAKSDSPDTSNNPQFEPYLKAGGTWNAAIPIARHRQEQGDSSSIEDQNNQSTTWTIEIISQVVFSSTASVNFEVLVGRDESSLDPLSSGGLPKPPKPASLRDHWPTGSSKGKQLLATKGVYSDSITLLIDDTASLWNTPNLPTFHNNEEGGSTDFSTHGPSVDADYVPGGTRDSGTSATQTSNRKRIHLVVLTHGLHSNLGADMLYLKESIDAASKNRTGRKGQDYEDSSMLGGQSSDGCSTRDIDNHDGQEEQVIVRGFPGNAARTERGIQYLGKRLAKYVLLLTYPDQPHLPRNKTKSRTYSPPFPTWKGPEENDSQAETSCIDAEQLNSGEHHAYQITSISFIGHSLGGLVQTYAIAYIQKHSPEFFNNIKPINFIALATPFLGLSNENPMYVRFALDFGLVGRTGQDLGLSWTAPRVRSGWETIIGGKGDSTRLPGRTDARAKPLLRILPLGPAHAALTQFKHRTIYANLVNDGIVPLRTSCLLFLDWNGLERVEKARRENGIVGTMAEWGWAELTGANSNYPRVPRTLNNLEVTDASFGQTIKETSVTTVSQGVVTPRSASFFSSSTTSSPVRRAPSIQTQTLQRPSDTPANSGADRYAPQSPSSPLSGLFSMFKLKEPWHKQAKVLRRSQTLANPLATGLVQQDAPHYNSAYDIGFNAPPPTTVFESAGDILMPPLPPMEYIVNPAARPRTIWHDRVYGPGDIPPPTIKRRTLTIRSSYVGSASGEVYFGEEPLHETGINVEEKIARAYHRGLSWRKVLVRLEPDAHNNIIVRRMFTNAYGWPVVKHLVDTHFGSSSLGSSENGCKDTVARPTPPVEGSPDDLHDHTQLSPTAITLTRPDSTFGSV